MRPSNYHKNQETCRIVDFAVLTNHRVKSKEGQMRDKCQDLARELKKTMEHEVTVIAIVIGAFGTVSKGLIKELEVPVV